MKIIISIIGWLAILIPLGGLLVIFGVVSLEMNFGIAPPVGLAAMCLGLSVINGVVWQIANGSGGFRKFVRKNRTERLLGVRFLKKREEVL